MIKILAPVLFIFLLPASWTLECYVCTSQDNNNDKCIKTVKTCDILDDRCLTKIRWGSTPYWDSTGKKQFYVSKSCSSEKDCKDTIQGYSKRCDRIWYNDWECAECCHGDRCNYFVTLAGVMLQPQQKLCILSICALLVLKRWLNGHDWI